MEKLMKKLLFSLVLTVSMPLYPLPFSEIFWKMVGPVASADTRAEFLMREWHEKTNGAYILSDDQITSDGDQVGHMRRHFPLNDPTSHDRCARAVILAWHGRLLKEVAIAAGGPLGMPDQTIFYRVNPDKIWNDLSLPLRCWLTVRHRKPYTHMLSLGKWALELAIVAGCIKLIKKISNKPNSNNNKEKDITSEENATNRASEISSPI